MFATSRRISIPNVAIIDLTDTDVEVRVEVKLWNQSWGNYQTAHSFGRTFDNAYDARHYVGQVTAQVLGNHN